MRKQAVVVDENLLEQVSYQDNSLPLSFCEDHFDEFINGEMNCHWHEEFEFALILKGQVEYFVHQPGTEKGAGVLNEGEGVFVNTKALHMARQKCPGSVMSCFLFPAGFFTFQPMGNMYKNNVQPVIQHPLPGLFLHKDKKEHREILETVKSFLELDKTAVGYELQCVENICRLWRKLLLELFAAGEGRERSGGELTQERRIRLMLSHIHTHYFESMTVNDIARAANISPSECFRCFKGIVKKTPIEYLLEYRLSRAAQLLTNTEMTVLDICLSCGFHNPSYFGKTFKEKCGVTPGGFRRRSRKSFQ